MLGRMNNSLIFRAISNKGLMRNSVSLQILRPPLYWKLRPSSSEHFRWQFFGTVKKLFSHYTLFYEQHFYEQHHAKKTSLFSFKLSSKNNKKCSKKCLKNKCVCFREIIWLILMKMKMKMKHISHRHDINRHRT